MFRIRPSASSDGAKSELFEVGREKIEGVWNSEVGMRKAEKRR